MNYLAFLLCSAGFLLSGIPAASAGTTTLTTYYPAPAGNYQQLRIVPQDALSNPCKTGTLYVDNNGNIQYCDNSTTWGNLPGAWKQNGNNIYPTDTSINPNLNVGIGVTNPSAKLEVAGDIKASGNITAAAPTLDNHVATKAYVDAAASGPGGWTCTIRSASQICGTSVACQGNEKAISGGCSPASKPGGLTSNGQGWMCEGGSQCSFEGPITVSANCCK